MKPWSTRVAYATIQVPLICLSFLLFGCANDIEVSQGYAGGASSSTSTSDCSATSRKRVFVTSTTSNGNLGGISGGDTKCATLASAAGLCGTWKAWLSDATTTAISRIADVGPWYHVDRATLVFSSKAQIAAGTDPSDTIYKTETGANSAAAQVWTGSTNAGQIDVGDHCQSWASSNGGDTGQVGLTGDATRWSDFAPNGCGALRPIYCFEQ